MFIFLYLSCLIITYKELTPSFPKEECLCISREIFAILLLSVSQRNVLPIAKYKKLLCIFIKEISSGRD